MAVLTNADFGFIRDRIHANPAWKEEFKTWGLSKDTYKAAFQAVEDYFVNAFNNTPTTSYRTALEGVTGPTTVARAQMVFFAWSTWKASKMA